MVIKILTTPLPNEIVLESHVLKLFNVFFKRGYHLLGKDYKTIWPIGNSNQLYFCIYSGDMALNSDIE